MLCDRLDIAAQGSVLDNVINDTNVILKNASNNHKPLQEVSVDANVLIVVEVITNWGAKHLL